MRAKKIFLMLALLCAVAQGAWAASWSVEMTDKYQVVLNGANVITISAPVYDEYSTDHWVSDGKLKVTWTDGSGTQQTKTVLQWGFSGSHASDESTLPVGFSTEVGGSIDITQGYSSNHFTLTSSDGTVSKDITVNSDEETTGITTTNFTNHTNSAGAWHTLDGRRLDSQPSRAGVYIYKGIKKVVK